MLSDSIGPASDDETVVVVIAASSRATTETAAHIDDTTNRNDDQGGWGSAPEYLGAAGALPQAPEERVPDNGNIGIFATVSWREARNRGRHSIGRRPG